MAPVFSLKKALEKSVLSEAEIQRLAAIALIHIGDLKVDYTVAAKAFGGVSGSYRNAVGAIRQKLTKAGCFIDDNDGNFDTPTFESGKKASTTKKKNQFKPSSNNAGMVAAATDSADSELESPTIAAQKRNPARSVASATKAAKTNKNGKRQLENDEATSELTLGGSLRKKARPDVKQEEEEEEEEEVVDLIPVPHGMM